MNNYKDIQIIVDYTKKLSVNSFDKLKLLLNKEGLGLSYAAPKENEIGVITVFRCEIERAEYIENLINTELNSVFESDSTLTVEERLLKLENTLETLVINLKSRGLL